MDRKMNQMSIYTCLRRCSEPCSKGSRLRDRIRGRRGFTLLEIMLVLVIIAILLAIGVATFLNQQSKAEDTGVKADLANLARVANADYIQSNINYTNLIPDPSCAGSSKWSAWYSQGGTIACSTAQSLSAPKALQITDNGTSNFTSIGAKPGVGLKDGETYTISLSVRVPISGKYQLQIGNGPSTWTKSSPAFSAAAGVWTRVAPFVFTNDSGADLPYNNFTVNLRRASGESFHFADGDQFYYDDVIMQQGKFPVQTYFDGDSPGAYWSGTPEASASKTKGETSNSFSPQIATVLANSEPEYDIAADDTYTPGVINIEYVNPNVIIFRAVSKDGTNYNYELDYSGGRRENLKLEGTDTETKTNLATNPKLDNNLAGWSQWWTSGNPQRVAAADAPGIARYAVKVAPGSAEDPHGPADTYAGLQLPFAGTTSVSSISFDMKTDVTGNYMLELSDAPSTWYAPHLFPDGTKLVAGEWKHVQAEDFTPGNANRWVVRLIRTNGGATSGALYITNLLVENGSSISPYVDGSYPDAVWTNQSQPGNSTSSGYAWDNW